MNQPSMHAVETDADGPLQLIEDYALRLAAAGLLEQSGPGLWRIAAGHTLGEVEAGLSVLIATWQHAE